MFTNVTAAALAAERQHTLRTEADQARLVRIARAARRTAPRPVVTPGVRPTLPLLRRFRAA